MNAIVLMVLVIHLAAFNAEGHNAGVGKNSFENIIDAAFIRVETILKGESEAGKFFGPHGLAALAALKTTIEVNYGSGRDGEAIRQVYEESRVVGGFDSNGIFQPHYRIPARTIFYARGPFFVAGRVIIANYPAGTTQFQTLALLHELAHNIASPKGGYFIPDDGPSVREGQLKSYHSSTMIQRLFREQIWQSH